MQIIIVNDFCHVNGGASYVAIASARKLAERGTKVSFLGAVGPIADDLRHPNIECVCLHQQEILKEPNHLRAAGQGIWNRTAAQALRKILAGKNPADTLIHLHLLTKALSPLVMKVALDSPFRTVATLHDYAISCPNGGFFVYPTSTLCHRVPLSFSCISCNCDRRSYAQKMWRVGRNTVQSKIWGIDRRLRYGIFPSALAQRLLTPYLTGLKISRLTAYPVHAPELPCATPARHKPYVFVGRMVPEKGAHLFAEAVRRAKVPAIFIGDGEDRKSLEKLCPEAEFTGWLDQAAIIERLRQCRALVFPSLWYETLGLVVVEAMAQGLPVIVSDATAAAGLIQNGGNGLLFSSGHVDDLQLQIERLREDQLVEILGRRAYAWYWDNPWTTEKHVGELESLYTEILRDTPTRIPELTSHRNPTFRAGGDLERLLLVTIPGAGGVLDYLQNLVEYLWRKCPGLTVDLAYSSSRAGEGMDRFVDEIRVKGGEVLDLKVINAPQPGDFLAVRKIARLVKRRRPQLIHAQSSKAGSLCRALPLLLGDEAPPIVYSPHAYFGLDQDRPVRAWVFNRLDSALGSRGLTINCSADERNFGKSVLGLPGRKLILIHHGIDLQKFCRASPDAKLSARRRLGLPLEGPLLISIGRNAFQKNYPPLYQAVDRLLSNPEVEFTFAHAGDRSGELIEVIAPSRRSRVRTFQYLVNIEDLLHAADGFILASRYEGLSLSVLQALACGLKIFLASTPGNNSFRRLGFEDIAWIEPAARKSVFSSRIEASLLPWLRNPIPPQDHQLARARQLFNAAVQHEKTLRAYRHVIAANVRQ